jgi:hypothetical protein
MTHDHGKSDSAIVAAKPTNNVGQPAVEPVEPRGGDQAERRRAKHTPAIVIDAEVLT